MRTLSVMLTFLAVVLAWVFFRASDLHTATTIAQTMLGLNGVTLPDNWFSRIPAFHAWLDIRGGLAPGNGLASSGMLNWIWILLLIVWFAPNTQTIMQVFRPALDAPHARTTLTWRASGINVWALGGLAGVTLLFLTGTTEFIYHQF